MAIELKENMVNELDAAFKVLNRLKTIFIAAEHPDAFQLVDAIETLDDVTDGIFEDVEIIP